MPSIGVKSLWLVGILFFLTISAQTHPAAEVWVRRYTSQEVGSGDYAWKVASDSEGNAIVAGESDNGTTGRDILVIKYSESGQAIWTNRYDGPGNGADVPYSVMLDPMDNVFVIGGSSVQGGFFDYVTLAYSAAGVPLWTNRYDGPPRGHDVAYAAAIDGNGNIFLTGTSLGAGQSDDWATVAYSANGTALWTNRYNGPVNGYDQAQAISVDSAGNVFVTGGATGSGSGLDYVTIAYSGSGVPLWTNRYNGSGNRYDWPSGVAVNIDGNVFVTGSSTGGAGDYDYATIAYSVQGQALWTNRYSGTGNTNDSANAIAVDSSGNVIVTGVSAGTSGYSDYATIAYSVPGVPLWTNRYNGPGNSHDSPSTVAIASNHNIVVTGGSTGAGGNFDYVTIFYSDSGVALWTNRYDGPGNANDVAQAVAVNNNGAIFVAGYSFGSRGDADFAIIAYSETGMRLWTNCYDGVGNGWDICTGMAVDSSGNVFVTGASPKNSSSGYNDFATIAYSASGVPLWTNRYNNSRANRSDGARSLAVDGSGKVFVTGYSEGIGDNHDYVTIAYSGAGVPLWTNSYGPNSTSDSPRDIAVDTSGNVFVTGGSGSDYLTIAYSGAGMRLWTNRYNGPTNGFDSAVCVAVNANRTVFVTGSSQRDYATVAYSVTGVGLWTNRYDGTRNNDFATALAAADTSGNVFVTGFSVSSGGGPDWATVAYSGSGIALWTNRYSGAGNATDDAVAVVVDNAGKLFVTGSSATSAGTADYVTIAYSEEGAPLWTNRYNGPVNGDDLAQAVAVDRTGNVFVTGKSTGAGGNYDYATIAYSGMGVPLWTNRYSGFANGPDIPATKGIAVAFDGAVYVAGSSDATHSDDWLSDYVTVKYVWRPHLAIQPLTPQSSNVNLALSGVPGLPVTIQRAVLILGPWTNLGSSLIRTNGLSFFQDSNAPTQRALYRATQ